METTRASVEPGLKRVVAQLRAGVDPERNFHLLFQRFHRPLLAFFLKRGLSLEDSQDLTQETFVRVHQGVESFEGRSSFDTWLFSVAANQWRNRLRHGSAGKRDETAGRGEGPGSGALSPPSGGPLDELLEQERRQEVRSALQELPPQMRRCAVLRLDQDRKYGEIAVLLQISIQTVKSQLHHARRHLREKLREHFPEVEL